MTRVCYWCRKHMGEKDGNHEGGIFYSICDECAKKIGLDERLPELLWAIAALRTQNNNKEQKCALDVFTTVQSLN